MPLAFKSFLLKKLTDIRALFHKFYFLKQIIKMFKHILETSRLTLAVKFEKSLRINTSCAWFGGLMNFDSLSPQLYPQKRNSINHTQSLIFLINKR